MSDDSRELSRMEDILSGEDYLPKKPMSRIEELLLDGAMVPKVDDTDNGKVLKVIDGEWQPGEDVSGDNLPPVSSLDNGKVLKVVSGEWNIGDDKSDSVIVQLGVSYASFSSGSTVTLPANIKTILLANYYSNPPVPTYLITSDSVIFEPREVNKSAGTTQFVQIRWGRFYSYMDSVTYESNVYNDSIIYNTQDNDTVARFSKSAALQTIPPVDSGDAGKVMQVGNDGTWQANALPTYDEVPPVVAGDVGKVLKATAVGEYDWGDESRTNAVQVPPVIYENSTLMKANMSGFPGLEKVYISITDYAELTDAERKDLSKIYYVSYYSFYEADNLILRVNSQVGSEEIKLFVNGFTSDAINNNMPSLIDSKLRELKTYYYIGSIGYDSNKEQLTTNTPYVYIDANHSGVSFSNGDHSSKSAITTPAYSVIDLTNAYQGMQSNAWSEPYDLGNDVVIFYGGKQYTDFTFPKELPAVSYSDAGKVLKVDINGYWAADTIPTGLEVVKLSQTDYDSLSDAQKKNGKMYLIDASIFTGGIPRVSGADSKITASSQNGSGSTLQAWLAFDGNDHTPGSDNDGWVPNNGDNQWIKYQFASATPINKIMFKAVSRNTTSWSGTIYIEGSNDDTTWENILSTKQSITTELPARSSSSVEFNEFANGKSYTYIRLRINNQSYQKFELAEFDADVTTLTYDSIYYMDRQYSTMYEPVPEVTMADVGKILQVNADGEWDKGDIPSTCTPVEIEAADYHALTTPQKEDTTKVYFVKAGRVITDPVSVIPRNPSSSKIGNNTDGTSYATSATLAFDGVMNTPYYSIGQVGDATGWSPGYGETVESAWVSYEFDTVISNLTSLEVYAWNMATSSPETTWTTPVIVEGSNDGTTWFNILADGASSFTLSSKESEFIKNVIPIDNTVTVNYIRFRFLNRVNYYNDVTFAIAEIYAYTGNVVIYDDSTYYKGIKHGKTVQELPSLVAADEGKVLKAVNGLWTKDSIYREISQADYDLLPASKNSDGIIYFITDNS